MHFAPFGTSLQKHSYSLYVFENRISINILLSHRASLSCQIRFYNHSFHVYISTTVAFPREQFRTSRRSHTHLNHRKTHYYLRGYPLLKLSSLNCPFAYTFSFHLVSISLPCALFCVWSVIAKSSCAEALHTSCKIPINHYFQKLALFRLGRVQSSTGFFEDDKASHNIRSLLQFS